MAVMIPETAGSGVTAGEREVFAVFKKYLPDDWVVYHNPVVLGNEMDFVVIAKGFGVLILEVKDYLARNIISMNPDKWELSSIKSGEQPTSPLKQAMNYSRKIETCLKRDADLIHQDGKAKGKLKFPYGYGVVLSRISEVDVVKLQVDEIIPSNQLISQTDLRDEDWLSKNLVGKLLGMFHLQFGRGSLGDEEMKRIRYHLFPELRVGKPNNGVFVEDGVYKFRSLEAMDLHQERVAKSLGAGNRLIRGVTGSGKTLILAARAKYLAVKNPGWKILVLTNNSTLTSAIAETIKTLLDRDGGVIDRSRVSVSTFTSWVYSDFKVKLEDTADLVSKIEHGITACHLYDAILIDEGQDFLPEWFKLVSLSLNKDTGCLLIVEDRAQNILKRKVSFLKQTGLDFRGRSNVLQINYRNTNQVASFAWKFFQDMSRDLESGVDESTATSVIIQPKVSPRTGSRPLVKRMPVFKDESNFVVASILKLLKDERYTAGDVAVLYRVKQMGSINYIETLLDTLSRARIPHSWVTSDKDSKRGFNKFDETVKVLSLDSAKGLDFRIVFIINADSVPLYFLKGEDIQSDIARMYVGMTRATDHLIITYSGNSLVTQWLDQYNVEKQRLQQAKLF